MRQGRSWRYLQGAALAIAVASLAACAGASALKSRRKAPANVKAYFASLSLPVRLAVLEFSDASGRVTPFSAAVTDEVTIRLSGIPNVRLMERSRLKLLLEEHSLEMSGMITRKDALRLGSLLPADFIATGSYVPHGESTKVNGRIVDLVSGEIVETFRFDMEGDGESSGKKSDSACNHDSELLKRFLSDLRSKEKQEAAVDHLLGIPFDESCAPFHTYAMTILSRGSLYPVRYKEYLKKEALGDDGKKEEIRKRNVLDYYRKDGVVDDEEWNTALLFMRRARDRDIMIYIRMGLNLRSEKQPPAFERIDALFEMVKRNPPGRPTPLTPFQLVTAVNMAAGNFMDTSSHIYKIHLFEHHMESIPEQDGETSSALRLLSNAIRYSRNSPKHRVRFSQLMIRLADRSEPRTDWTRTTDTLWRILPEIHGHLSSAPKEFSALAKGLSPWLCTTADASSSASERRYRNGFLARYSLSCESNRDADSLTAVFASSDESRSRREDAARTLAGMGRRAAPAEKTAVALLKEGERGEEDYLLRKYSIEILSAVETKRRDAIEALVSLIGSRSHGSAVRLTLEKLDPGATLPVLLKRLQSERDPDTQKSILEIIRSYGPRAGKAVPVLKKLETEGSTPSLRKAAGDTLRSLNGP